MKKLLVVATASALIFSSNPAGAELLKNFRLSGQIDMQATAANNVLDFATRQNSQAAATGAAVCLSPGCAAGQKVNGNNDRIGNAQTRVMVHLDWDLLDDVHSHLTFVKNDRNYGTGGGNPTGSVDGNEQSITAAGAGVLGNIYIQQAYFKVDKVAGQIDTTFGRQFYGDSGDIVIYFGPSDKAWYGLPSSAIDAARFDWSNEWMGVTGLVAKLSSAKVSVTGNNDVDVRGLNILFKPVDAFHASIYGWNRVTHATGASGVPPGVNAASPKSGKNDNLFLIGLKAKIAAGGWWLKAEFDQNFGDNRLITAPTGDPNFSVARHYMGWAVMGNTGFKMESDAAGMFGLWSEVALGSGASSTSEGRNDGFTPINGDYRPGSIYGRFSAVPGAGAGTGISGLGGGLYNSVNTTDATAANSFVASSSLNNRLIWGVGTKFSPGFMNKLTFAVSWWDFRLHRFATTLNGVAPYMGNRHIGSELDIDAIWTHSENVAFATGWGTFQPGGLIYEAAQSKGTGANLPASQGSGQPVNPVMLAYFDVRVKF